MKLFRHDKTSEVSPAAALFAAALAILLSANPGKARSNESPITTSTVQANFHDWLIKQAKQWVSEQEGLRPEEVSFLPLDERLSLNSCDQPLLIDSPFGTTQTLRLRCPSTNQQVFLKRRHGLVAFAASPTPPLSKGQGQSQAIHFGQPIARSSSEASRAPVLANSKPIAIAGRPAAIEFEATVLVATTNIASNQPLTPTMFRTEKRKLPTSPSQFFSEFDGLEHLELSRPVQAGNPLRRSDTRKSVLVRRGSPVQFLVSSVPGLSLSVKLEAVEDGFIGEQIRLRNPESGKVLTGLVTARGEVKGL
jgi:flagella basal body P-ring formation protein FlgA